MLKSRYATRVPSHFLWDMFRDGLKSSVEAYCGVGTLRSKHDETDILAWGEEFCPHYFDSKFSIQHRWMAARFGALRFERNRKVVIRGPRGSAKSTMATFLYPLHNVCEGVEPYMIFTADTVGQAIKYLAAIKTELEGNELLREAYPRAAGQGPVWNAAQIITKNGICLEALGTGSKIRGRRYLSNRPGLIITDDPEGDAAYFSAKVRQKTNAWYNKSVLKAGAPDCNFVVVGSMVHRECLVAKLSTTPGWEGQEFRSILTWPTRMDLWDKWEEHLFDLSDVGRTDTSKRFYQEHKAEMDAGAQVLWPDRYPLYDLMLTRATGGHSSFEAEHQGKPVDPAMVEWDPELFEGDEVWFDDWPVNCQCRTVGVDPSKGKSDKSGDYQAQVFLAVCEGVLFVDADIQRRPIDQFVVDIARLAADFHADVCVVEANQFQESIVTEAEHAAVTGKLLVPILGVTNYAHKATRIRRLSPYITRRRVKFKRRSRGAVLLREQLMDFPNGEHDDGPDAFEMALHKAAEMLYASSLEDPTSPL